MTATTQNWWRDRLLQIIILLFGAGVAWGTMKIDMLRFQERQEQDHAVIEVHETRLDANDQCMAGLAATQEAMLEQITQLNQGVQSINEFLRTVAQRWD
jgi:cell division protein FtsB